MVFLPAWPLFPVYRAHKHLETALDGCLDVAGSEEQAQGCADLVWDQDTADPSLCPECSMHRARQAVRLIPGNLCRELATEHLSLPPELWARKICLSNPAKCTPAHTQLPLHTPAPQLDVDPAFPYTQPAESLQRQILTLGLDHLNPHLHCAGASSPAAGNQICHSPCPQFCSNGHFPPALFICP